MTEASKPQFPIGLTIATVIALAILVALGNWQLKRLSWKLNLLAHVATLQTALPQPLDQVLAKMATGADLDLTRVTVTCSGLATARYVELYSVREAGAGLRLISSCNLGSEPYRSILVDRGFVSDQISARPAVDQHDVTPIAIIGVLRKPDRANFVTPPNDLVGNHWYSRDIPAMAKALGGTKPAPLTLMAETSSNPEWKALNPAPLPAEISNRHLEYALTWFGLAGALACVYAATLWKRWKG